MFLYEARWTRRYDRGRNGMFELAIWHRGKQEVTHATAATVEEAEALAEALTNAPGSDVLRIKIRRIG